MVIVFDANGTLLNTESLDPHVRRLFGASYSASEWFHEVIEYAIALTLADDYQDFDDVALNVLRMAADARGICLGSEQLQKVKSKIASVPLFPDVKPALKRLKNAGFRLAVLSNSGTNSLQQRMRKNNAENLFEQLISVSAVRKYKPARETYGMAAARLGVTVPELMMVAAHPWDLIGAQRAGCRTAFVARPGKSWFPEAPVPVHSVADLTELADVLLGTPKEKRGGIGWVSAASIAAALGGILLSRTGVLDRAYRMINGERSSA